MELATLHMSIANLIRNARKNGVDWIWSNEDIDEVTTKEKGKIVHTYTLSSADIAGALKIENNNRVPDFFKKHRINSKGIQWDTEGGAWYPKFNSRNDAERCIRDLNKVLDKLWL